MTIPDSVTSIGDGAFYECSALTNVSIPDSVTSIGKAAFSGCSSLASITIPDSVVSIEDGLFYGCSALTSVVFPDSLTSINDSAFGHCTALTSITIPDGVTSIGYYAFHGCDALTSVTIPDSVTSIGGEAFSYCHALTDIQVASDNPNYCSLEGVLLNKSKTELVQYPAGKQETSYGIPDSVMIVSEGAFSGCTTLISVTIPDSVTSIERDAFAGCTGLTNLTIGNGVTSIGHWAFVSCTSLTSVTIPASVSTIAETAFGWYSYFSQRVPGFTIYGYNGTAAQSYAEENGFAFVSLDNTVGNFTDVKPKDWYADAVLWAVENGITAGVDEHHFAPKQNCTREQVVTFLWAAKGSPEPQSDANPFKDVKKNSWFRKSVLWAVEQGVTGGVDETHFGVGKACDRAQVVMFLWAAAGKPEPETAENKFTDVKKKDYFYSAVLWAVENGVTGGTTPTTFSPKNICTRAQVVTFLYAAYAEK